MHNLALAPTARPPQTTLWNRVSAFARTRWQSHLRKRRIRATVRILQELGDETLKDIGLDRSEIESAVATNCAGRQRRCVDPQLLSP
jgi:uncharacterized protein YjiS (DUF1127 family)